MPWFLTLLHSLTVHSAAWLKTSGERFRSTHPVPWFLTPLHSLTAHSAAWFKTSGEIFCSMPATVRTPYTPSALVPNSLTFSYSPFSGLVKDIRRKIPFYASDFKDALHIQCLGSFVYVFLGTLTPNVTFGGLLGEATDQYMVCIIGFIAFLSIYVTCNNISVIHVMAQMCRRIHGMQYHCILVNTIHIILLVKYPCLIFIEVVLFFVTYINLSGFV